MDPDPNQTIRQHLAGRFFTARKTKPMWAMQISDAAAAGIIGPDLIVHSLEGNEPAKPTDALCKGIEGEFWPQSFEQIHKRYTPTGRTDAGWTEYTPNPDRTVQAAQVTDLPEFQVQSNFGPLTGKKGDYVVYARDDPNDVWIVAQALFERTYSRV
jgi:hypothetical protein